LPPDVRLRKMARKVEVAYRVHVLPELRRRRWHVGPGERRRLKHRLHLARLRRAAAKAAEAAEAA
jgi:hypothetical protein